MSKNIAVLGDSESIKGFAAVGLDIFPCDSTEEAPKLLRRLVDGEGYAVIYVTEEMFEVTEKERARCEERLIPAIIPIKGVRKNNGIGLKRLSRFVEQAVGSDILFND